MKVILKLVCFFSIISFASCVRVGEYYTEMNNENIEDIQINTDRSIKDIGFAAYSRGDEFTSIIFFKLIDTSHYRFYQIKDLRLEINNIQDALAKKHLSCIDQPGIIRYNQLSSIPQLSDKILSGLPLEFVYKFKKNQFPSLEKISIYLVIKVVENGIDIKIEKKFEMIRHTRYKSQFVHS